MLRPARPGPRLQIFGLCWKSKACAIWNIRFADGRFESYTGLFGQDEMLLCGMVQVYASRRSEDGKWGAFEAGEFNDGL